MTNKEQGILITASGADSPGITAKLTELIAQNNCQIMDIGQSVLGGFLTLSILLDHTSGKELLKDLLFEGKKMGLTIEFSVVDLVSFSGKKDDEYSYVISCVHQNQLDSLYISKLARLLASYDLNINEIHKTASRFKSIDIVTYSKKMISSFDLKKELVSLSSEFETDVAFQKNNHFRSNKRLIVFDMDSTLIQTEVVNEIAHLKGVGEKVTEITEMAMNGELDFKESLKARVSLFKGLPESTLQEIAKNLPITEGVVELIQSVKLLGYKLAIISGGFTYFANHLKHKLGMDYAFANELEIKDGMLTGEVVGTIVDAEHKATLLEMISQMESISLEQTVAVGDGANDLPMLAKAGLGVAFHAKPYVRERATHELSHGSMESLLYFLGINR